MVIEKQAGLSDRKMKQVMSNLNVNSAISSECEIPLEPDSALRHSRLSTPNKSDFRLKNEQDREIKNSDRSYSKQNSRGKQFRMSDNPSNSLSLQLNIGILPDSNTPVPQMVLGERLFSQNSKINIFNEKDIIQEADDEITSIKQLGKMNT